MENNENLKAKATVLLDVLKAKQNIVDTQAYVKWVEGTLSVYKTAFKAYDLTAKNIALDTLLTIIPDLLTIIKVQSKALDESINVMAELYGDLSNND